MLTRMMYLLRNPAFRILSKRYFHASQKNFINPKNVEEVKIPVPWGHIAGKWWGSKDVQPILALHGWQDNADTWEPLLKIVSDKYSVLAIDFPGSGFSSHLPPLQHYHFSDTAHLLERLKRHYNFGPMVLLGHSGGSATAFLYSCIYSENVRGFFGIDYLLHAYKDEHKRAKTLGKLVDKIIELANRNPSDARKHSWEEAKKVWAAATRGSVTEDSAEILMKRAVANAPGGKVFFTRDNRLKTEVVEKLNVKQAENLAENIKCPVFLIKVSKSPLFDLGLKYCPHILDIIKKYAKDFEFHTLEGGHHIHMDQPEVIWPMFEKFLIKL